MTISIKPTEATLGALITEVDLRSLTKEIWATINQAFLKYAVLVFPNQHLNEEEQTSFAERFGEIEILTSTKSLKTLRLGNVNPDGSIMNPEDHHAQVLRGNEGWHTDSSYMPLSAKAAILSAQQVPSKGGETEWADMRAAYDALDKKTKNLIKDLSAFHSLFYSQAKIGHEAKVGASYGFNEANPPLRPLVKKHPVTGRNSLYIGRHAYDIPGLSSSRSEELLENLVSFACQPPRIFQHSWKKGDLVIWDNRCVLHRALKYDYKEGRVLLATRIAGDPKTELVN